MIKYFFRPPNFPVICAVQGVLIGAETPEQYMEQVGAMNLPPGELLPFVDATGEGWIFDTDHMIISPITSKKRWTKKEVIDMFNKSCTSKQIGKEYSSRSLSSKRFNRIMAEIVALIRSANKRLQPNAASPHC
jgi:hypothetical protein